MHKQMTIKFTTEHAHIQCTAMLACLHAGVGGVGSSGGVGADELTVAADAPRKR